MWSLLHRRGAQCQHSGNLLALGRQHKIGIIAVDYGTQWVQLLKDSFILEKETVEGEEKRGALVPSLLSHGGHRHDISGLKELVFWTCPLRSPPSIPIYSSNSSPLPPFFSSLCQFGCSAWPDELGPLLLFACETKPLRRKREEAESFTWYQPRAGMAASASPSLAPFLLRGAGVTPPPLPPVPQCPSLPPCNLFIYVFVPHSHPRKCSFFSQETL